MNVSRGLVSLISNNDIRKQGLDPKYQMMLENDMQKMAKKPVIAWLLWFFLGMFGAHRFYLGHTKVGVGMVVSLIFTGGVVTLFWWIIEAITLSNRIKQVNENIESQLIMRYELMQKNEKAAQ